MSGKLIVLLSGVFVLVAGVGLIVTQFVLQITMPYYEAASRSVGFEAYGVRAEASTTYIGFALVIAGVVLEVVGLAVGRKTESPDGTK